MANEQITVIAGIAAMLFVLFVFAAIWAARYRKVGLNQVLIVSGRARQLPDGTKVGFRIVKGGGTFVFPIYERADVLSLEVMSVEIPGARVTTASGPAAMDCVAQVKIKGDDPSVVAAMEHFLSKTQAEVKELVRPMIEKHLAAAVCRATVQQIEQDAAKYAASMETAASPDLNKMGLGLVAFWIQNVRAA